MHSLVKRFTTFLLKRKRETRANTNCRATNVNNRYISPLSLSVGLITGWLVWLTNVIIMFLKPHLNVKVQVQSTIVFSCTMVGIFHLTICSHFCSQVLNQTYFCLSGISTLSLTHRACFRPSLSRLVQRLAQLVLFVSVSLCHDVLCRQGGHFGDSLSATSCVLTAGCVCVSENTIAVCRDLT